MKRELFTILSALSLLLFLTMVVLWVVEPGQFYHSIDFFGPNELSASIYSGTLILIFDDDLPTTPFRVFRVPFWPVALVAAVLPAIWLHREYRARRRRIAARTGFDVVPLDGE